MCNQRGECFGNDDMCCGFYIGTVCERGCSLSGVWVRGPRPPSHLVQKQNNAGVILIDLEGHLLRGNRTPSRRHATCARQTSPRFVEGYCIFSFATTKVFFLQHHCRNCGLVFCDTCSSTSMPIPRYGYSEPVRVCDDCVKDLHPPSS